MSINQETNDRIKVVGTNIAEKATVIWNVADMLRGPFRELESVGLNEKFVSGISKSIDSEYYFFDNQRGNSGFYRSCTHYGLVFQCE